MAVESRSPREYALAAAGNGPPAHRGPSAARWWLPLSMAGGAFAFLMALLSSTSGASLSIGPVNYTSDATWALADSPIYIDGDIRVEATANLTIEAGVTAVFNNSYEIRVLGGLNVQGTGTNRVTLTYSDVTYVEWVGIVLQSPVFPAKIDNVTFKRVSNAITVDGAQGNVEIWNITTGVDSPFNPAIFVDRVLTIANSRGVLAGRVVAREAEAGVRLTNSSNVTLFNLTCEAMKGAAVSGKCLSIYTSQDTSVDGLLSTAGDIWVESSPRTLLQGISVDVFQTAALLSIVSSNGSRLTNFDLSSGRMGGLVVASSGGLAVDRGNINMSWQAYVDSTGVAVAACPGIVVHNISVRDAGRAVWLGDSPGFLLDNVTTRTELISNLEIANSGGGSVVRNFQANGNYPGIRVARPVNAGQGQFDIDFSVGVTMKGVPILGLYKQTNVSLAANSNFPWMFVFGSPGLQANGLVVPFSLYYSNIYLVNSPGAVLKRVTFSDFMMFSSSDSLLDGFCCGVVELLAQSNVTFSNSSSSPYLDWMPAVRLHLVTGSRLTNLAVKGGASGGSAGLTVSGGDGLVLTGGSFEGSTAAQISGASPRIVGASFCSNVSGGVSLTLWPVTNGFVANSTFCAGKRGIFISGGGGTVLENLTFRNLTTALHIEASGSNIIRWNAFFNCSIRGLAIYDTLIDDVYENNFYCSQVSGYGSTAGGWDWSNSTLQHGNYWNDYSGVDANGDRIGDTPYGVPGGNHVDRYPLGRAWEKVPPVAVLAPAFLVDEDVALRLSAASSRDNDMIVNASWEISDLQGPANLTGLTVNYTFQTPGIYAVKMTVYDYWGNSASAWANVTVRDKTPPIAVPETSPFFTTEDVEFTVRFNVTDNDLRFPEGARYFWNITGRATFRLDTSSPEANFTIPEPGNYTVRIGVADAAGNVVSASAPLVVADTTAPTCSLTTKGTGAAKQGDTVTFTLSCSDNDLSFPANGSYAWRVGPDGGGVLDLQGSSTNLTTTVAGLYWANWSSMDASGNEMHGTFNFSVRDTEGPVWIPPGGWIVADGETATLSVMDATDFSGIASALWSRDSLTLGTGLALSYTFTQLGNASMSVLIADTLGNAARYNFTVRIVDRSAPVLSNISLAAVHFVEFGDQLNLTAVGAFTDNDAAFGMTATFEWAGEGEGGLLLNPPSSITQRLSFARVGDFNVTLTATDAAGNSASVRVPVQVRDTKAPSGLKYALSPGPKITAGTNLTMNATAQDLSGVEFLWRFSDGSELSGSSATRLFADPGNFTVRLIARDGAGNEGSLNFTVQVSPKVTEPGPSQQPNPTAPNNETPTGPAGETTTFVLIGVAAAAGILGLGLLLRSRRKGAPPTPPA